jgi:hypothetical protein
MNKIIVVTIKGCQRCQKVKEAFKNSDIKHMYTVVPCEDDSGMCDELEGYTRSTIYPMVIVKDTTNINYIYFTGNDYINIGKEIKVKDTLILCPQFSVDDIITAVKNKIK